MSKKTKNDIVAEAERILQELEKRRADHAARRSELEDARKTHAYAAHAQHDAAASRLLDGIITEVAKHDQQTKALTDAIDEASRRVAFAREREQREQEKAKATALLARFEALAEHGAAVDAGLELARAGIVAMFTELREMLLLGGRFPTDEQLESATYRVIVSTLGVPTKLRRRFDIPPDVRAGFTLQAYLTRWRQTVENGVQAKLGAPQEEKEVA